jgi:hypothetical protein
MPAERITEQSHVYVPVWELGKVTGWDHGTVLEIYNGGDKPVYLVRLHAPHPRTQEQIYYGWSVECGACRNLPRETACQQCRP